MKRSLYMVVGVILLLALFGFAFDAKAEKNDVSGQLDVGINLVFTATSGARIYAHVNLTNTTDSVQFVTVTTTISESWIITDSLLVNVVDANFGNRITETSNTTMAKWQVQLAPKGRTRLVIGAIAGLVTETVRLDSFYRFNITGAYVFSGTQPLQIDPSQGNVLTSISPSTVSAGQEFCVFGQITGGGFVFRLPDGYFDVPVEMTTETMACGLIQNIGAGRYQIYLTSKFGAASNPMWLTVIHRSWMPTIRK